MIGGRSGAEKDLHVARAATLETVVVGRADRFAGLSRGGVQQPQKIRFLQQAGTGAAQQQAVRFDELHREAVEVEVAARSFVEFGSVANQLGRIENDDIELPAVTDHVAHVWEDVGLDEVRFDGVELRVAAGDLQRMFVEINARDLGRVAEMLGRDREPAGVAAQIEDTLAGGEVGESAAIVSLIAEEAGLVSAEKLDAKLRAEFLHDNRSRQLRRRDRLSGKTFLSFGVRSRSQQPVLRADEASKPFEDRLSALKQAEPKCFGRKRVAIAVDDDAGEPVTFSVDQSISVGDFIQLEDIASQSHRAS